LKNVPLLKAALAIGNSIFILIGIISTIDNGINTDKFPISLAFVAILIIPLIMLIIYGLRAYQTKNDSDSYFALLAISTLFDLIYLFVIYGFVVNPKLFLIIPHWFVFSIIMLLIWVLNVIAYLNRGKWMNK